MDTDDLEPEKKKPEPKHLDEMSIKALNEYKAAAKVHRPKNWLRSTATTFSKPAGNSGLSRLLAPSWEIR